MQYQEHTNWPSPHFPEFILHHLPVGLLTVDADLRITYFNPTAEQITGYSLDDAQGRFCGDLLKGGQCRQSCPLRTVLNRSKDSVTLETTIRMKSGQTLPVRLRTAAMFDGNGHLIGALEAFSDISELKQYELERTRTLSIFAHDMKNPLLSIAGFVSRLLEGKAGDLTDRQRKYLEVVHDEAKQIQSLASDFLDVARLGREGASLAWEVVDLVEALRETSREFEQRAEAAGMTLTTDIDTGLPSMKGDRRRLRRAIGNLLDNALKYAEHGEVRLEAGPSGPDRLRISVLDQGPGLTAKDLESIFESFQRGSAAAGKEGTGLGLAAVKSIAEAHYGRLEARNRDDGGAEFTITLPRQKPVGD